MARAHFAVQQPSRQSARRLATRMPFRRTTSFELSQSSAVGTSASDCSSQYTSITKPEWGSPYPWFSALLPNSHLVGCRNAIPSPLQHRIPPHGRDKGEGPLAEECDAKRPL